MAQTTNKTVQQARTKKINKGTGKKTSTSGKVRDLQSETSTSARHCASTELFSKQIDLIKSLKSKLPHQDTPNFKAENLEEDYFVALISLALDLGLDDEVNTLLSSDKGRDTELSDFFNSILKKLIVAIKEGYRTRKDTMMKSLINALNNDGYPITANQFNDLHTSLSHLMMDDPIITFTNEDENGNNLYYLGITQYSIENFHIAEHEQEDLAMAIYSEISEISSLAMLSADSDVISINSDICLFEDHLGTDFIKRYKTKEKIIKKAIETGLNEEMGMDENEFDENFDSLLNFLISNEFHKENPIKPTCHLFNWYKNQVTKLKKSMNVRMEILEPTGHHENLQFVTMDINALDIINSEMAYFNETPECQHKISLIKTNQDTINYLIESALARDLFNIFISLSATGKPESYWQQGTIEDNNLDKLKKLPKIL